MRMDDDYTFRSLKVNVFFCQNLFQCVWKPVQVLAQTKHDPKMPLIHSELYIQTRVVTDRAKMIQSNRVEVLDRSKIMTQSFSTD
jgi:hypothetical protein